MKTHVHDMIETPQMAIATALVILLVLAGFMEGNIARAHGGKTHNAEFTALQALQKATELYDKLVASGKLDETWETGLATVEVVSRGEKEELEYRVGFHRNSGDPLAVYIFLSAEGEYSGSNFNGKW
jgi:hypothetical protein